MGGNSPCASCKSLRRRCAKDCIFAPYFPPDDPQKFTMVHKVFGASNVGKMLQELPVYQRADAVSSLVYEANARMRDPVYGCVGAISCLQNQVYQLQMELAVAQAQILCIQMEQQQQQQLLLLQEEENNVITCSLPAEIINDQMVEMMIPVTDDMKSIFMSSLSSSSNTATAAAAYNNNLMNSLEAQQYLLNNYNFAPSSSSSSCSVIHDPLKRESLWT